MPNLTDNSRTVAIVIVLMLAVAGHVPSGHADYVNPAIPDSASPAYWLDQGGLFSAYGNYPAAVRAYEKSLALGPGNGEAHFGLGVALGSMGDYQGALASVDKAISLAPNNGRYHYGRGWVLMLAGRADEAYPALRKASDLGNMDARMFLQYLKK